jgi:hypothetical protein
MATATTIDRIAILVAPLLFAACVSQGPDSRLGTQDKERKAQDIKMSRTSDCVFQSTISGFEVLDDRYVVLFANGSRKAYLANLSGGCLDVRNQSALAPVDGDGNGQICGFGRDSIAYRRMGMVEDCRILGLEQLSDERRLALGVGVPPKPKKKEEKQEDKPGDGEKPAAPQ